MKKLVKTLILLPMWPLIWVGKNDDSGCGDRARAMLQWHKW